MALANGLKKDKALRAPILYSLTVRGSKAIFQCFDCGRAASKNYVIKLVLKYRGVNHCLVELRNFRSRPVDCGHTALYQTMVTEPSVISEVIVTRALYKASQHRSRIKVGIYAVDPAKATQFAFAKTSSLTDQNTFE